MRAIIDRFEGEYAVVELENDTLENIPKHLLPTGAGEGTVLIIKGTNICIDKKATERRKKKAAKLLDDLF